MRAFQLGVVLVLVDLYGVGRAQAAVFSMSCWICYIRAIFLFAVGFLVRDNVHFLKLIRSADPSVVPDRVVSP